MSVLKKFVGDTAIYGLSTILSRMINFLLTYVYVRVFSTATYGIFTKFFSYAAMLNAVLAFGMETTFFRFLHKHEDNKEKVFGNTFIIILFVSTLFLLSLFLFSTGIATWLNNGEYSADYVLYVRFFGVILVADALVIIPFANLRASGRPIWFSLVKFINIITNVSAVLIFLYLIPYLIEVNSSFASFAESWYRPKWLGYAFISNLIASVVTLLILAPQFLKVKYRLDRNLAKEMFRYSFPVLISNISFIINEHFDKTIIDKLVPGEQGRIDTGIYGAVSRIAVFLSIFVQAFRLGAEPFFFSYAKNENAKKAYSMIMEYFIIAMVLVMVGISANIDWLKYFIRNPDPVQRELYWSGLHVVPVLLMGFVLLGIYMNLSIWYKLTDQTRFGVYISGVGAALTIVLSFIFIPLYSYVAAVWITITVYTCMIVLSYYWGQSRYPIPYKVGKALTYILSGAVLCWVMFALLDRHVIYSNLLFIGFIAVCLYSERKLIRSVLGKR